MKKFVFVFCVIIVIFFLVIGYFSQRALINISESQYVANIPPPEKFDEYFTQAFRKYFFDIEQKYGKLDFPYTIIGQPHQSGIAFPKFYVWIIIKNNQEIIQQGIARAAAIDKQEFDIINFMTLEELKNNISVLNQLFPSDVAEEIEKIVSKTYKF